MARDLLERRRLAASLDGTDLAALRRACGITQQTVADALGVGRPAVCAWEQRRNRPTEAYARVIAGLKRHAEVTW